MTPVAAVGDGDGDGAAAERFHQWTGAGGNTGHLVGLVLDRRDIAGRSVRAWCLPVVKALTMRMPCKVSCNVSRMRVPPWNCVRAIT